MKRILLLICLFTVSFSLVASSQGDTRQFLTGFFQALKGNDWKLNEECFGPAVEAQFADLNAAIKSLNFQKAIEIFSSIALETKNDCPIQEIVEIQKKLDEKVRNGELLANIKNNANQILRVVMEVLLSQTQRTPYVYGKAFGSVVKIVLYDQAHNTKMLTFLAAEPAEVKITKDDFEKFFKGFLAGVSSVAYDDNKCYKEINGFLDEIESAAQKLYNAVENKSAKEFTVALAELTTSLIKIKGYDANCHVTQLIKSISVYSSGYAGLAKLVYNITTHTGQYYDLTVDMIKAIKDKSFENAGNTTGKIAKVLLSWETS